MFKNILSKTLFLSLGISLSLNLNTAQAMDLESEEFIRQKLVKEYEPPSMDELSKRFFLIHKTTRVPDGDTLYPAGQHTPYSHTLKQPTCPFSLHWSAFCDFEWKEGAYNVGIIAPFDKLKDKIVVVSMTEVVTLGPYNLSKEDYLLVPETLPTPHLSTTLIGYPVTKKLSQAIQDNLKENGRFCIRSVPEQSEYEWEDREGIIDDGSQVSPELFFANFSKTYPYVSFGSEGGIKTGEWDCLALANHYPHIVYQHLSDVDKAFKLNKWFFVLYPEILNRLNILVNKHQRPTSQFVKDRVKDILNDLKQYGSEDLEEVEFSKRVFKVALSARICSKLYKKIYKKIKGSRGSLENLEADEREELTQFWTLIYPAISISELPKIMTFADKAQ